MIGFLKSKPQLWFLIVLLSILAAVQVATSNSLIVFDTKLENIQEEIQTIEQENELLQQKIASFSSLTTIKFHANRIGLNKVPPLISIKDKYLMTLKRND